MKKWFGFEMMLQEWKLILICDENLSDSCIYVYLIIIVITVQYGFLYDDCMIYLQTILSYTEHNS